MQITMDGADNIQSPTFRGENSLKSAMPTGKYLPGFLDALDKAENLILVDPRATRLAGRADLWPRLRPGSDAALALGMMNVLINEELYDKDFVCDWTVGFEHL